MSKPLSRANSSAVGTGSAPVGDAVNVQVILRCRCGGSLLAGWAGRRSNCLLVASLPRRGKNWVCQCLAPKLLLLL